MTDQHVRARGREFVLKLLGTSQKWPKKAVFYRLNACMHKVKPPNNYSDSNKNLGAAVAEKKMLLLNAKDNY